MVLAALAIATYAITRITPRVVAPTQQGTAGSPLSADAYRGGFGWALTPAGTDPDTQAELTRVVLMADNRTHDLGVHQGTCARIADDQLLADEVSGVLCWFAGGGDELGVFQEGDRFVVKQGRQDEGDAETGGFRGDFRTIVTL